MRLNNRRIPGTPEWRGITNNSMVKFLACFWESGLTQTQACRESGVSYERVRRWLHGHTRHGKRIPPNALFVEAFAQAKKRIGDKIENAALKLALGYEEPVVYQGRIQYYPDSADVPEHLRGRPVTVTKYSEAMLKMLLPAWKPEYREVKADVNVNVTFDISERLRLGRLRAAGLALPPPERETRLIEAAPEPAGGSE